MPTAKLHSSLIDEADVVGRRPKVVSMRFLLGVACLVVISAGIKAASDILTLILLGFLLAYSALPFVKWIMQTFRLPKTVALAIAVGLLSMLAVVLLVVLFENVTSVKERIPIYEEHARNLYQQVAAFLNTHSIDITSLSATRESTSNQILKLANLILPEISSLFSNGLVVVLLGAFILLIIAERTESTNVRSILTQVQNDVARYVGALATTGVLTALANFVLLLALGVDFPLVWAVLYFFLNFIPSIGFLLALVPPGFLALLMLGWKKALLVVGGLVLIQLVANSAIKPMFLRRERVEVSSVEKMLSLLWWGFLLGPIGGILAIPLTLAIKRFIPDFSIEGSSAGARSARPVTRPQAAVGSEI